MDALRELLEVDSKSILVFFYSEMKEVGLPKKATDDEILHVSSVLASYAQASENETSFLMPLKDLSEFFDQFVLRPEMLNDIGLLLNACAQGILLNGFFRDQMAGRHNVEWYDKVIQGYYRRARHITTGERNWNLFTNMSANFHNWAIECRDLNRRLIENRYLLRFE